MKKFFGLLSIAAGLLPLNVGFTQGAGRYTTNGGTVVDNKTGLVWQKAVPAQTFRWDEANTYCSGLGASLGGNWRLPNVKELQTLVDDAVAPPGPMIDAAAFPGTPLDFFWSSNLAGDGTYVAWCVSFKNGITSTEPKGLTSHSVRCVH